MRKVTEITSLALFNFQEKKVGNSETRVRKLDYTNPDEKHVCSYLLHGNEIARFDGIDLQISDCRYQTVTTKERLNGILERAYYTGAYPYFCSISQKNYVWYFAIKKFPTDNSVIKYREFDSMVDITGFIHLRDHSFHSDNWKIM